MTSKTNKNEIIKKWLGKLDTISEDKKQKLFKAFEDEFGFDVDNKDYWSTGDDIYGIVHKMAIPKSISKDFCEVYFSVETPGGMTETDWDYVSAEKEVKLKKQTEEYSYEVLFVKRGNNDRQKNK